MTEFWVTTDFLVAGGEKILGPFKTANLAYDVRYFMEKVNGKSYAVSPVPTQDTKDNVELESRNERWPTKGGAPITVSSGSGGYDRVPWFNDTLTLLAQTPDGQLHYAKTKQEKMDFAWSNFNWIVLCWPGKYCQDIFLIDDMKEFRRCLGFRPANSNVFIDEDGVEWELSK